MKYAFFDLDGTLIPVDSSILWAETLLSHVGKDEKQLRAERIQYDVDYKNGCLDINKFEDFEMKLLARFPRRELDELRVQYLKRDIMPHVLPIAVDLVKKYREAGARVVMITASYRYAVEPIAELFGIRDLICAEPEEKPDGEFTGRWISENCGGSAADLKESAFFSDSMNDFPLLDHVVRHGGKAVATNPDDRLRSTAQERHWEILELFSEHKLF